jgi:hypothetical protein
MILESIFGPIQISKTAFGPDKLTFKKPVPWAGKNPKKAKEIQKLHMVHLAQCAAALVGVKGVTMEYKGERMPLIAYLIALCRIGRKDLAEKVYAAVPSDPKDPKPTVNWGNIPAPPAKLTAAQKAALKASKRALGWSRFAKIFGVDKVPTGVSTAGAVREDKIFKVDDLASYF